MKKSMFALACAASVAVFADTTFNSVDFEGYTPGTEGAPVVSGTGGLDDAGGTAGNVYFCYAGAAGAEDGSKVKAFETVPEISGVDFGSKFLELSTEGGILWRSINEASVADDKYVPGEAMEIPEDTGLYVDTMVQFTATEDDGTPELDNDADKLAIWLQKAEDGTTTLCVRAGIVDDSGTPTPTTFKITNAPDIQPETWHRLTVKTIKDFTGGDELQGFTITVDGVLLTADKKTVTDGYMEYLDDDDGLIAACSVFASLHPDADSLSAVGFKGSGAIDNLQVTDFDPNGEPEVLVDLSISAENATVTGIEAGKVAVGAELSFKVAAVDGYTLTGVTINGNTVTADAQGNYTYTVAAEDTAVAVVVATEAVPSIDWDHPDTSAGTTAGDMFKLTGPIAAADGAKLATWAKGVGSVSFDDASTIKLDAFLLNCANDDDAITAAKAAFKIISIEQDAEGAWVAKVTGEKRDGAEYGNGYVVIKGAATVDGTYNLATTEETAKFFKAFLVLEAPAAE